MIKKLLSIAMLWLICIAIAHADAPKADLTVQSLNRGLWPAEFRLSLTVPKDHHAYLDKGDENIYMPVVIDPKQRLAESRLSIADLKRPSGVYDGLVKATVLRDQGDFIVSIAPLDAAPNSGAIALDVQYQLCNEITNVCFRPQIAQVNLDLPATVFQDSDESLGLTDRLLSLFKSHQDNTFILFWLMFLGGLLSVATPCVYPMLPITSMFIVNRADGASRKVKQHAFVYVIGIIMTYMALGLIAGMTGGAFNVLMQSAWVNIGFALFFSFFAMALLGFYELAFMQNEVHALDQRSSRVKGLTGTWLMGGVAGLVISPCVGPIVFALLLQVADQIADKTSALAGQSLSLLDKLSVATQGSIMMGGFGLGVGLPFFIVSVIRFKKLPKANVWMNKVKYAFGLAILYFAYVYFAKGMGVLGVEPLVTQSLALGMLAVWIAVVHCNVLSLLPTEALPNQKMHHYVGVMLLVIGVWLVVASLGQTPIVSEVHANNNKQNASSLPVQEEAGITWYKSFDVAQKVAQQTGKPIFIDFYASWCANCVAFKEKAAHDVRLNQALREKAVALKLVDKEPGFEKFREDPEHRQLKIGLPYFVILSSGGKILWSGTDYKATERMIAVLHGKS